MDQERRWETLPKNFPFESALPARAELVSTSTTFKRMTCNTNPCTPSRSVLYTGQHITKTGCFANFIDLPLDQEKIPTLGTMMRREGYYTVYKGKWHLGDNIELSPASSSFLPDGSPRIKFGPGEGGLPVPEDLDNLDHLIENARRLQTQDNLEPYGYILIPLPLRMSVQP
jgi:arylsulfatase A-like enzyme